MNTNDLVASSTVWLVYDDYKNRYFAMKVNSTECSGNEFDTFEIEIHQYFKKDEAIHPGRAYVTQMVDCFYEVRDIGITVFFIFELLAGTLHSFSRRPMFPTTSIGQKLVKRFSKQLLLALDYAHKSGIIHTGE